jgi:methyl-accepting chemotaxis protein
MENNESSYKMFDLEDFINASAIVSKADANGKITYVNQKFCSISGYSLEEVIGLDHNIVNSGEHSKEFWTDMYKTVIKEKKIWNAICTNRAKDGSLYYVDTFIKCNFDDKGNLLGFMSIRQDVTGLKTKENEIRNRMNAINQSNAVIEFELNGTIKFANDLFLKTLGYSSSSEIVGKHHSIFMEDDVKDSQTYIDFWERLNQGTFFSGEITRKKKDGTLIYLQATYNPIIGTNGEIYSVMKVATDITKSFNQQREIERKEFEISNRMDAINRSNAVIEFELNGTIKFANDLFLKTLGYSISSEIVGKHHSIFMEDDVKDSQAYIDFWDILREGTFFSGEITRKKKDGTLIYLQATYNPIISTDGRVYSVMKIATDITKSFNQQVEIEKKNTYLEHAAKILRHDMHSGINTYMPRGLSSLDRRITDEQLKELKIDAPLKMIREGLRHTQKVYKGVYEFTNLVKKDVVLNRSDLNIKDILEDYLSATAYRPQVIIEDLGILSVNEALFCTAIDNLIRNGLKYNDSPSKFVKIYKKDFNIYIEDNGRGMSAEEFKLLSQPYTRKEDQKESGTGLGLNICVAILEEHKFNISCRKLSQGTQIKIKINN